MADDGLSLIAAIHGLAAADRRACCRVARLLCIGEIEAGVLLGIADGRAVPVSALAAALDLSEGGARALVRTLEDHALVRSEPLPARPRELQLRMAPGAAVELAAALAPLTDRLEAAASALGEPGRQFVARYIAEIADACRRR
jgi:hypothetical protein